jgi:hypothetical protein
VIGAKFFEHSKQTKNSTSQILLPGMNQSMLSRQKPEETVTGHKSSAPGHADWFFLANDQPDTQFFFRLCLFQISTCFKHCVLIIKRINCINTTSGICHSM